MRHACCETLQCWSMPKLPFGSPPRRRHGANLGLGTGRLSAVSMSGSAYSGFVRAPRHGGAAAPKSDMVFRLGRIAVGLIRPAAAMCGEVLVARGAGCFEGRPDTPGTPRRSSCAGLRMPTSLVVVACHLLDRICCTPSSHGSLPSSTRRSRSPCLPDRGDRSHSTRRHEHDVSQTGQAGEDIGEGRRSILPASWL